MAHNINTYIGRRPAWHKLGQVTDKYSTTAELLADEGFRYLVFKSQLHDGLERPIDAWGTFRWNYADRDEHRRLKAALERPGLDVQSKAMIQAQMKELEAKSVFLGSVGEDYQVIQHSEGFETIDALMRTADGAHYETAGVLGKGEKVWALADLALLETRIGEDLIKNYLLFTTGHDGSAAHDYRLVSERVVCENTWAMAMSEHTRAKLSIRHTKNAVKRLVDARAALASIGDDVKRMEDRLNFLAGRRMNREAMTSILDRLFPKQKDSEGKEKESSTRRNNILGDVLKLYEVCDGNAFPEQRGTAYNLLNAITEYADHMRGGEDNRAESALFGSGEVLKSKAIEVISSVARDLEAVPDRIMVTVDGGESTGSSLLDDVLAVHANQ